MTIQFWDKKAMLNPKPLNRTQVTKICGKPKNLNVVDNEQSESSFIVSIVK